MTTSMLSLFFVYLLVCHWHIFFGFALSHVWLIWASDSFIQTFRFIIIWVITEDLEFGQCFLLRNVLVIHTYITPTVTVYISSVVNADWLRNNRCCFRYANNFFFVRTGRYTWVWRLLFWCCLKILYLLFVFLWCFDSVQLIFCITLY